MIKPNPEYYSFALPESWTEGLISNTLSGNFCMPRCDEPWVEAIFFDPQQGRCQVGRVGRSVGRAEVRTAGRGGWVGLDGCMGGGLCDWRPGACVHGAAPAQPGARQEGVCCTNMQWAGTRNHGLCVLAAPAARSWWCRRCSGWSARSTRSSRTWARPRR